METNLLSTSWDSFDSKASDISEEDCSGRVLTSHRADLSLLKALVDWRPGSFGEADAPIQVIDMFSGCGGMSLGFAAYGQISGMYELVGAIDLNQRSLDTYHENFGVPTAKKDIFELADVSDLVSELNSLFPRYNPTKPLVLIGCAPCQGFSAHRKKDWDKPDQRNSLVDAFGKIVAKLLPTAAIMENVPELLSGRFWKHFETFRSHALAADYFIKQEIHNAAEYGTPRKGFVH